MKKVLILLITALALFSIGGAALAQDSGEGAVRFVHAVPGVSGVDVYVDGQIAATDLGFGEATTYLNAPAGTHSLTARPAGMGTDLWTQEIAVDTATPRTFIASSASTPEFVAFDDDFVSLEPGTSRLKIIHALDGGPDVTVTANGQTVVEGLAYGDSIGVFDVPADTYEVSVADADGAAVIDAAIGLTTGTSHLVTVIGTASDPQVVVLTAPTTGDEDSGFVRLVHGVADGPAVDVYANDTLIAPNLAFGTATEHLALPAGDYSVELRAAGTADALLTDDVTVEAGTAATVVAQGTAAELALGVYADDTAGISADSALVSLINVVPGDSSVTLDADGSTLVSDVASGSSSAVVSLEPSIQEATAIFTIDDVTGAVPVGDVAFYGGVYYNAVAVDGTTFTPPTVLFFPTSLEQALGSAPGGDEVMVVEIPPTEEAVEAVSTEVPAEAVPTEAPAAAPTNPPVAPAVVTEEPQPTARIALDPGVNLQLRQYPSTDAFSLGLAPAGSVVTVNGRAGALAANEDGTVNIPLPLQDTPFGDPNFEWVDPVTQLDPNDEDADLNPEETWINFTYDTPDGGQVDAWTLALYLDITDPDGDRMKLKDLDTVPSNLAGEARATDMTPPPPPENLIIAHVVGIQPGANLNIRRTPDTQGEVLGRIPAGSAAEVEGIGQSREWLFVSYQPGEGGVYTGWVSIEFVEFEVRGESISLEDLFIRGILDEVDEETRTGSVSAGATQAAGSAPTPDPVRNAYVAEVQLNPDANLNLRRTPDVQAEVLVRIPDASQVIVEGRTEDAAWLRTSYEGIEGWIASDFVSVTFNGVLVTDLTEIPVIETAPAAEATAETTG